MLEREGSQLLLPHSEVEISDFFGDSLVSCDIFLETVLREDTLLRRDTWSFSAGGRGEARKGGM